MIQPDDERRACTVWTCIIGAVLAVAFAAGISAWIESATQSEMKEIER